MVGHRTWLMRYLTVENNRLPIYGRIDLSTDNIKVVVYIENKELKNVKINTNENLVIWKCNKGKTKKYKKIKHVWEDVKSDYKFRKRKVSNEYIADLLDEQGVYYELVNKFNVAIRVPK